MSATPSDNQGLHGNAPDRCRVGLLIIDSINALDVPGNQELVRESTRLGRNVARLKRRCRDAGIPDFAANIGESGRLDLPQLV